MRGRDLADLLALAAAWGSSFIFLRMTVPDFGPIAVVEVRVGIAAIFLLVLLLARGKLSALIKHWKPIAMVGIAISYSSVLVGVRIGIGMSLAISALSAVLAYGIKMKNIKT